MTSEKDTEHGVVRNTDRRCSCKLQQAGTGDTDTEEILDKSK